MRALVLEGVRKMSIRDLPDPVATEGSVIIRTAANGVCRSDWHNWIGDTNRAVPVVLGHEMAGIIEEVTPGVTRFKKGDRVVIPLCGSEGTCGYCQSGRPHLCDAPQIPGLSYSVGYGEYVCVPLADRNLVPLPDEVASGTAQHWAAGL